MWPTRISSRQAKKSTFCTGLPTDPRQMRSIATKVSAVIAVRTPANAPASSGWPIGMRSNPIATSEITRNDGVATPVSAANAPGKPATRNPA